MNFNELQILSPAATHSKFNLWDLLLYLLWISLNGGITGCQGCIAVDRSSGSPLALPVSWSAGTMTRTAADLMVSKSLAALSAHWYLHFPSPETEIHSIRRDSNMLPHLVAALLSMKADGSRIEVHGDWEAHHLPSGPNTQKMFSCGKHSFAPARPKGLLFFDLLICGFFELLLLILWQSLNVS